MIKKIQRQSNVVGLGYRYVFEKHQCRIADTSRNEKNQNFGNNIQRALHNMVQLLERCIMSHKNYTVSSNDS